MPNPFSKLLAPFRAFLDKISPQKTTDTQEETSTEDVEEPRKIIRQGVVVIVVFFGALGLWAVFGHISGAVVAPGKIKIETERKTVQHLEGGIVEDILVREGEQVKEGQELIILESVQVDASTSMLQKQLVALLAAHARAITEKNMESTLVWPQETIEAAQRIHEEDVLANEEKIFITRRDFIRGQISLLQTQLAQLDAQISGYMDQLNAEIKIVATLEEELAAKRQLFAERYLEKSHILELERMLASHQGNRGRLKQAVAEARQKVTELKLKIQDTKNRFIAEATAESGKLQNEINQIREKIRPLRDAKKRLRVTAPVSGRVVGLRVHSKGGVVRSGEPLMDIVPANNPLIAETHVPVNKITKVHPGQEALVQLDAFDTRLISHIAAKVTYVSADRLEERVANGVMPYYLCYVEIDPSSLEKEQAYLSPGMPVTVFITTQKRRVIYYILEPLLKNWDRALRE